MPPRLPLSAPRIMPPLDPKFRPAVLANHAFRAALRGEGISLVIGLERAGDEFSRFETQIFPGGHPSFKRNFPYVERLVKFLLWQRGGFKLYISGPPGVADHVTSLYSTAGIRNFDFHFMPLVEKKVSIPS